MASVCCDSVIETITFADCCEGTTIVPQGRYSRYQTFDNTTTNSSIYRLTNDCDWTASTSYVLPIDYPYTYSNHTRSVLTNGCSTWTNWCTTDNQIVERVAVTEEQAKQERLRALTGRSHQAKRRHRRRRAENRAQSTLGALFGESTLENFKEHKAIEVTGSNGKRFLIVGGKGLHGNVYELDEDGVATRNWCGRHKQGRDTPETDGIIAQALALMADAEAFLKVANPSGVPATTGRQISRERGILIPA